MAEKKMQKATAPIGVASNKKEALETAMKNIERTYGKGSIMRLGDSMNLSVEVIPTGSLALDLALGIGGIPKGRIIEIYGPESSGKTTLALHILAQAQKLGGEVAFIDAEHALDPAYAQVNKHWKLRSLWFDPVLLTLWWSTPWRPWSPRQKLKERWGTPTWASMPGS